MRRTAGPDGRAAREFGQGLTAAAISVAVRAIGRLVVLPVASVRYPKSLSKVVIQSLDPKCDLKV